MQPVCNQFSKRHLPYTVCLFSLLFLSVSLGIWESGRALFYVVLVSLTIYCVLFIFRQWKENIQEKKTASLLLIMLMVDYWVWVFAAEYYFFSSYVFLVILELHRLICILLLLRCLKSQGNIEKVFNFYMLKVLFIDIVLCVFYGQPRAKGHAPNLWYQIEILHPLFSGKAFPWFFFLYTYFELNIIGLYVVKFRSKISK